MRRPEGAYIACTGIIWLSLNLVHEDKTRHDTGDGASGMHAVDNFDVDIATDHRSIDRS
jgi:hypothetical protein